MKAEYFERLIEGEFLEFKCAGIRHHLLKTNPEARGKLQEGDEVELERNPDCVAGDKSAVMILHEIDFKKKLGFVERDLRHKIAGLIDAKGKVYAFINYIHGSYIDMCLPLDDEYREILRNAKPMRHELPASVLPEEFIIGESPQDRQLRLTADTLLRQRDMEKIVKYGKKYADAYGYSLAGKDEERFAEIRWKIEDLSSRSTVNGQQSTELREIYNSLMKKHFDMTHGDNTFEIYKVVKKQYDEEAKKDGGVIEHLCSKYFLKKKNADLDGAQGLMYEVEKWLNSIFVHTYFNESQNYFATNIFYASLTNEQLRVVMSHVVVYEYLTSILDTKSSVNSQRSTINEVVSGKQDQNPVLDSSAPTCITVEYKKKGTYDKLKSVIKTEIKPYTAKGRGKWKWSHVRNVMTTQGICAKDITPTEFGEMISMIDNDLVAENVRKNVSTHCANMPRGRYCDWPTENYDRLVCEEIAPYFRAILGERSPQ